MLPIPLLIAALASHTFAKVMKWTTNPYLIPPMPNSPTQYLVFHGQLALNQTMSRIRCEAMGGDLADVDDTTVFTFLHKRLHAPAFIGSWQGDRYRETCIALYPGGAIAVPDSGCGRLGSICEVPFYGTHGIDLRRISIPSDPSAKIGVYEKSAGGNMTTTNDAGDLQIFQNAFVKTKLQTAPQLNKDGSPVINANRFLKNAAQGTPPINSVTTVTIYGSIETDPALPCCRCCNAI